MKYQARPVIVDALEILYVSSPFVDGSRHIAFTNAESFVATAEMLARIIPVRGDFWVKQADGYVDLNPRAVFLRKYEPVMEKEISLFARSSSRQHLKLTLACGHSFETTAVTVHNGQPHNPDYIGIEMPSRCCGGDHKVVEQKSIPHLGFVDPTPAPAPPAPVPAEPAKSQ